MNLKLWLLAMADGYGDGLELGTLNLNHPNSLKFLSIRVRNAKGWRQHIFPFFTQLAALANTASSIGHHSQLCEKGQFRHGAENHFIITFPLSRRPSG
ncbi:MAG: hypothetical protein IKK62_03040 [Bacteroidaceae bacterium]|nr:hypothetical protein [Bacteroidaceae bacterium]